MNVANPIAVEPGLAQRLTAAVAAHNDAQEVAQRAAATRNKLVVEAIDAGMPQKVVADLAGITTARVHAIVATDYARP